MKNKKVKTVTGGIPANVGMPRKMEGVINQLKVEDSGTYLVQYSTGKSGAREHCEIFCEEDADGNTPRQQAEALIEKLKTRDNVYTWNLCKIIETSEHYELG
jgi:hypothetical protein